MKATRITIHCSDTKNGEHYDIKKIRAFHMAMPPNGRGWQDVGYHLVIQPSGEVQNGRPLNQVGAHVEGANLDNIGICLIGHDRFSWEQLDALRYKLDVICMTYSIPKWAIYCHNQFPSAQKQGKQCPSMEINRLLYWYVTGDSKVLEPYILKK